MNYEIVFWLVNNQHMLYIIKTIVPGRKVKINIIERCDFVPEINVLATLQEAEWQTFFECCFLTHLMCIGRSGLSLFFHYL